MFSVYPNSYFHHITEIPLEFFHSNKIKALILDVDNTLTTHDNPKPAVGVLDWLKKVQDSGIKCIILSNNSHNRVEPFAIMLSLSFEPDAKKPLTGGYKRACKKMGSRMEETAVIGDQLFTDILGGRLAGCHCILVDLMEVEKTAFFKFKRASEKQLLKFYKGGKR